MKITDLKCMVIGDLHALLVRIDTDEGISGLAQIEGSKHFYLKPHVLFYKRNILEQDPTDVERVMLRIRRLGAFKPWGSSVSAIEMALWDIAGKAAGVPVYKLLGGKIRDKVRVYNGGDMPYAPSGLRLEGTSPEDYFNYASKRKKLPGQFKIMKFGIGFHSGMPWTFPEYHYGEKPLEPRAPYLYQEGLTTERGLKYTVECVKSLKEALGDEIGLALDCGPGWKVPAAIRLAKALEPLNVMWLEDLITGD
ncbi:MAG: mandelate racemase/muconate lactonizing enzyme family protein, partial [Candidatus Bathyarchaeota archaeon]|nr:mandelate racemase/muconate lactonizing enzyme family protein [Candidatus Bathyarchaeota archaeon]